MRKKKEDAIASLIERIISEPVPDKGTLVNPLAPKKRQARKSRQVVMADLAEKESGFPEDVQDWTPRMFVDYFAKRYQDETQLNYRIVYKADLHSFSEIGKYFASNGLEKKEWTKAFIDWAFERREEIVRRSQHFTPLTLIQHLNAFYQESVLPKVERNEVERDYVETALLEEIREAEKEGNATELFIRFGIPVAATYYLLHNGYKPTVIEAGLEKLIERLGAQGVDGKAKLAAMFQRSIIRSPYPEWFMMQDWRERFEGRVKPFRMESWWRDQDYKGEPLREYQSLRREANDV